MACASSPFFLEEQPEQCVSAKPGSCCKVFLKKRGVGFGFIFKGNMQQKTASHIKPLFELRRAS